METYGYIYKTTNLINGKTYIGQHKSKDWDSNYIGSGIYLKKAIKKYGIKIFTCFPLAWAWNKEELNQLEIDYIAHYKPEYNIAKGGEGGGMSDKKYSIETKQKISESHKGMKHSDETKQKISEFHKGKKRRPFTEETKKKMSESFKKRILSSETKEKLRQINLGKKFSEETKRKMSEKRKGHFGWNKGKKFSEETRQKMSDSQKKRWQKQKES
jgi:group I intron endonuclease